MLGEKKNLRSNNFIIRKRLFLNPQKKKPWLRFDQAHNIIKKKYSNALNTQKISYIYIIEKKMLTKLKKK